MATINVHDVEVLKEENNFRVKGSATIGFTSTEVRLDVGFNLRVLISAELDEFQLSEWVKNNYLDFYRRYEIQQGFIKEMAETVNWIPSNETYVDELLPEGRTSMEYPFEFESDLSEWQNEFEDRFKYYIELMPDLVTKMKEYLKSKINVNLSPNIYGGEHTYRSE